MARVIINHAHARAHSIEVGIRLVTQVMYEVEFEAKIMSAGGTYSTGNLSESIERVGPRVIGTKVQGYVGSSLPYAASVHDGAAIHPIFPKGSAHFYRFGRRTGRPQLRFYWRKAGRVVFMPQIPGAITTVGRSHPGIKRGKKYLSEPLVHAAARHQMRVIIY
jgi:hypothetical protein